MRRPSGDHDGLVSVRAVGRRRRRPEPSGLIVYRSSWDAVGSRPTNAIRRVRGDQAGSNAHIAAAVTGRTPVPSGRIVKIRAFRTSAMRLPSGAHAGSESADLLSVSCTRAEPSG